MPIRRSGEGMARREKSQEFARCCCRTRDDWGGRGDLWGDVPYSKIEIVELIGVCGEIGTFHGLVPDAHRVAKCLASSNRLRSSQPKE